MISDVARLFGAPLALLGTSFLALGVLSASAAEYKLYVNDATACRNAGQSGDVCLVKATSSSSTTSTSTTSTSAGSTSTSSASDCVVTTWDNCGGQAAVPTPPRNTTSTVSSTSSTATSSSGSSSGGGAATNGAGSGMTGTPGTFNYGSAGADATGRTDTITLSPGVTTALPFSTQVGNYVGRVGIVPTSYGFPTDGAEVRMWYSKTSNGAPLPGNFCAGNLGSEGSLWWDQTGELSYGCQIPNVNGSLYLNLQLCISGRLDKSCSAAGAKAGSESARVYISGVIK